MKTMFGMNHVHPVLSTAIALAALLLGATFGVQDASAANTLVVTTTDDNSDIPPSGSLRAALANAADGDTIDATGITGIIKLAVPTFGGSMELLIDKSVTILGPGAKALIVDGLNTSRVFRILPGHTVVIDGLTIADGSVADADRGGGIASESNLTVRNCLLRGNSAGYAGGAIYNLGGELVVANSTFDSNSSLSIGGGICSDHGSLTVNNSTFSSNGAFSAGGAIQCLFSPAAVANSTFNDNVATLGSSIATDGVVEIGNNILKVAPERTNLAGGNGTIISHGFNLCSDYGGGFLIPGDQIYFLDMKIGPLADNGGPTPTCLPLPGSPAIDRGSADTIPELFAATDQRGLVRTVDDPAIANAPGSDGTDIGAVEIQGEPAGNVPPTASDDSYLVNQDVDLVVPAPGVLGNDIDSNPGDVLNAVLVTPPAHSFSFVLNADGSFEYLASAGFTGQDSFTYKANDGQADSNIATVTITVNPVTPANTPPTATDDSYSTDAGVLLSPNPGVLANDVDLDGDPLTAVLVGGPAHALEFQLNLDGTFTYVPNAGFTGQDSFTYKANDGQADSNIATVTITVNPITPANTPPTADDDVYEAVENTQLSIQAPGVLANDVDADGNPLTAVLASAPAHSLFFHLNPDGSFDYVAQAGFTGVDNFTYKVSDGQALSNVATVTIVVSPPNEADLLVGLGVDNLNPKQGDLITYTITVHNFGAGTARNAVVSDVLSSGTTFYAASANRGHFTSPTSGQTGVVTWYVGDIVADDQEAAQIQVTVVVKGRTTIVNSASASSDTPDPDTANNSASLTTSVAQGGSTGGGGGKKK